MGKFYVSTTDFPNPIVIKNPDGSTRLFTADEVKEFIKDKPWLKSYKAFE